MVFGFSKSTSKVPSTSTVASATASASVSQMPSPIPSAIQLPSSPSPPPSPSPPSSLPAPAIASATVSKNTPELQTTHMMAWISAVMARLAYLDPQQFLCRYTQIFGDTRSAASATPSQFSSDDGSGGALPTTTLFRMMDMQAQKVGIHGLLDDKAMLGLSSTTSFQWGLKAIPISGVNASPPTAQSFALDCVTNYDTASHLPKDTIGDLNQVSSWSEKVNIILGERRIGSNDADPRQANCTTSSIPTKGNPMLVFRSISDSNYGAVYIVGDKRAPHLIWVLFRGTANMKSATSYLRPNSITPDQLIEVFGVKDAGLKGIYKILQEQLHIILQLAINVAIELANDNPAATPLKSINGSRKLLISGHSLGGALATAFAGEYAQRIAPNLSVLHDGTILDVNIGCYSLAAPRIYGKQEAAAFCCLTQASQLCRKDASLDKAVLANMTNLNGRISYLRIVTAYDTVPALPAAPYAHPCSMFDQKAYDLGSGVSATHRELITMDCDVSKYVTNKTSTRCVKSKRPSITTDYSKTPSCTRKRRSTGILGGTNPLNHMIYCGILYAGVADNWIEGGATLDIDRLDAKDVSLAYKGAKGGDTIMRLFFYGTKNIPIETAKIIFFDLTYFRANQGIDASVHGGDESTAITSQAILSEDSLITSAIVSRFMQEMELNANYTYNVLGEARPPRNYNGRLFNLDNLGQRASSVVDRYSIHAANSGWILRHKPIIFFGNALTQKGKGKGLNTGSSSSIATMSGGKSKRRSRSKCTFQGEKTSQCKKSRSKSRNKSRGKRTKSKRKGKGKNERNQAGGGTSALPYTLERYLI